MITLYINGKESFNEFGIRLGPSAMAALMSPPEPKERIATAYPLEHGEESVGDMYLKARDFNLDIVISATNTESLMYWHNHFCDYITSQKTLDITTSLQEGVHYRCRYMGISTYSQHIDIQGTGGIIKMSLKLREENPKNRS